MTMRNAIKKAKEITGSGATVSAHYGLSKRADRAVRITGCLQDDAKHYAALIARAIGGTVASQAGFVCVWMP
jgi:hypothetical protein